MKTPAFRVGLIAFIGLSLMFWPLFKAMLTLWGSEDGYYSHGFLVPIISGYIVYRWWPRIKDLPVKPFWPAAVLFVPAMYVAVAAVVTRFDTMSSLLLITVLGLSVLMVAGWRWLWVLATPILYLSFCLPIWGTFIDKYTLPLQVLSSKVAYQILVAFGYRPVQGSGSDLTIIYLNNFTLDVGVPCSGLKLVLALTAFTVFFIAVARLRWWANLLLCAIELPLCIITNGLRISLIGIVGDSFGSEAGHKFHDWSGYLTLVICFLILFKIVRLLGWKD